MKLLIKRAQRRNIPLCSKLVQTVKRVGVMEECLLRMVLERVVRAQAQIHQPVGIFLREMVIRVQVKGLQMWKPLQMCPPISGERQMNKVRQRLRWLRPRWTKPRLVSGAFLMKISLLPGRTVKNIIPRNAHSGFYQEVCHQKVSSKRKQHWEGVK
jgi:hypothetical protein